MRTLLLLRGAPGCGKSTWIEQNGLNDYALSADKIRMMCSSPVLDEGGKFGISQSGDKYVWKILFEILEKRMSRGDFTVIDATNSKTAEMNRYKKLCDDYRYRMYCVDFTDIPIEVTKERNLNRPELKQVPEAVIDNIYARFATQKIPSGVKVIKPDELDRVWIKTLDLSNYKAVHHIGDIHGCFTALKQYFDEQGGIKDDEFYIFCGDYIDRGIENAEVIEFLLSICDKPNVYLLEGNHERWLWRWANGDVVKESEEFEFITKTALENAGIDKKEIRKMYRKFGQCAYYTFKGQTVLVTHGGISNLPDNLTLVSTEQMIKGTGGYAQAAISDCSFMQNTFGEVIQIHGHRNLTKQPTVTDEACNLEGSVEFGGCLRAVKLCEDLTLEAYEIPNTVFRARKNESADTKEYKELADLVLDMRESKYIRENRFGNISSFNFTKGAFFEKVWNSMTTKARGLFVNIPEMKIVARGYDKFFNINERESTELDVLKDTMVFPVTAYVKENGFLGLVSYNSEDDSLFITTKSDPAGICAEWFRKLLYNKLSKDQLVSLKDFCKSKNVTLTFECVDMENDPHIIEYPESELFLLDIIHNDITYNKLSYYDVVRVANEYGFEYKEKVAEFRTWQDFLKWYEKVMEPDYKYLGNHIEGFVIEDASGLMLKLKLTYYHFWKYMRGVSHEVARRGYIENTVSFTSPLANLFYGFLRSRYDPEKSGEEPENICSLRRKFFATEEGKKFKD